MDKVKAEVLRYLGWRRQNVPEDISGMVDECIALMRDTTEPRHIAREFDIHPAAGGISINGTGLVLPGEDIKRHLSGCGKAVLIAATLGAAADTLIRRWERSDLTRTLTLDACASQLIEEGCDGIERQIRAEASVSGNMITRRYSPGYGDFALEVQPDILGILDAGRRIGLTCTESFILLPRKSVTAVIGIGEDLAESTGGCVRCTLRDTCVFRKDDDFHGCSGMAEE